VEKSESTLRFALAANPFADSWSRLLKRFALRAAIVVGIFVASQLLLLAVTLFAKSPKYVGLGMLQGIVSVAVVLAAWRFARRQGLFRMKMSSMSHSYSQHLHALADLDVPGSRPTEAKLLAERLAEFRKLVATWQKRQEGSAPVGIVLVLGHASHNPEIAEQLRHAVGALAQVKAVDLSPYHEINQMRYVLALACGSVNSGVGVLILVDKLGMPAPALVKDVVEDLRLNNIPSEEVVFESNLPAGFTETIAQGPWSLPYDANRDLRIHAHSPTLTGSITKKH
jgi:hypothetical protein